MRGQALVVYLHGGEAEDEEQKTATSQRPGQRILLDNPRNAAIRRALENDIKPSHMCAVK